MAASPLSPQQKMMAARYAIMQRWPYLTSQVLSAVFIEDRDQPTLCVTKRLIVRWNPDYVGKLSVDETTAATLHELFHPLKNHFDRWARMGVAEDPLTNVAGDVEINEDLREMGLPLGDGWLRPEMYGLPGNLLAEEIFHRLRQQQNQQQNQQGQNGQSGQSGQNDPNGQGSGGQNGGQGSPGKSAGNGRKPGQSASGQGGQGNGGQGGVNAPHAPHVGHGWCGSGAGRTVAPEPADDDPRGRSEADVDRIRKEVANAAREHAAKGRGAVPAGFLRWAEAEMKPAKVNWRTRLARRLRHGIAWVSGAADFRHDHISRRQAAVGFGSGVPMLPTLRRPIVDVAVVFDTSGSMQKPEGELGLAEVAGILKTQSCRVRFAACDAKVHTFQEVKTWRDVLPLLKGGGGTSFIPAFQHLEKSKPRPRIVVLVTDGDGSMPARPPEGMYVIAVLVGAHRTRAHVEGRVNDIIEIDE